MSDARAAEARRHHKAAGKALEQAGRHRDQRDALVRALRKDDPATWTHTALAATVGCSPELIAHILRG